MQLKSPHLTFTISRKNYITIFDILPLPTYSQTLTSHYEDKVTLVYCFNHPIMTAKQWRWLGDMKLSLKNKLAKKNIQVDFIDEFATNENTTINNTTYSLKHLSQYFKADFIQYPKLHFTQSKSQFYTHLKRYAIRLLKRNILSFETLLAGALTLNNSLTRFYNNIEQYNYKELQHKVLYLLKYINKNPNKYLINKEKLHKQHQQGGFITGAKKKLQAIANAKKVRLVVLKRLREKQQIVFKTIANIVKLNRNLVAKIVKLFLLQLTKINQCKNTQEQVRMFQAFNQAYEQEVFSLNEFISKSNFYLGGFYEKKTTTTKA